MGMHIKPKQAIRKVSSQFAQLVLLDSFALDIFYTLNLFKNNKNKKMCTKPLLLIIFSALLAINAQEISDSKLETDNNCECVYYYLCDKDHYIIKNGENLLDIRLKDVSTKTPILCSDSTKWCCKLRPSNNNETNSKSISNSNLIIHETKVQCGKQFTSEKFPWLVEIFQTKKVNQYEHIYTCSGSIITPNIVLTSTHCVRAAAEYVVVLGNDNNFHEVNYQKANERKVVKRVLHEDYYSGGLYNDIALLVLEKPFDISNENKVNTICLPNYQEEFNGNHRCLAAGFNTKNSAKVKTVNLTIVDKLLCEERLRATRLGSGYKLHPSFLCASGTTGNDNCKGDGGTPLICQNHEGNYVQVGIVSWGVECENPLVPGLYANIANLKPWIDRKVKENVLLPAMRNASDQSTTEKNDNKNIETEHNCECVQYYLCDDQNYIITNGSNLIDNRNEDQMGIKDPIPCSNSLEKCCKVRAIDESKTTTKKPTST